MKLGVIDLGTNTFHLLIVQVEDNSFEELYRERLYVQLADEGIATIGPNSYQRATDAMLQYAAILAEHEVTNVKAFGTAALRRATNGMQFIQETLEKTGLQIELISGDREADLICLGVKQAVPMGEEVDLIMDIGGGSVEFILANDKEVFWSQSFEIGVAVLYNGFQKNDPISTEETLALKTHLSSVLAPLLLAIEAHPPSRLVGASGTFDVLAEIVGEAKLGPYYTEFPAHLFHDIYDSLMPTTLQDRLEMPFVPDKRAKLIAVAMELLDFVIRNVGVQSIAVSEFAMKEGILTEMVARQTCEVSKS